MIRVGTFATSLVLLGCGTDPNSGDDTPRPPGPRSAIESCIASGGQLAELWSTSNQHGAVRSIAVSGSTVVLGSEDGSVKQWSVTGADPSYGTRFADEGPIVSALAF